MSLYLYHISILALTIVLIVGLTYMLQRYLFLNSPKKSSSQRIHVECTQTISLKSKIAILRIDAMQYHLCLDQQGQILQILHKQILTEENHTFNSSKETKA